MSVGGDPAAPRHLSKASRAWWRHIARDFELESHHQRILTVAAEAWDRMVEARAILEEAGGPVYKDRFGAPRKHPAVSIEENARVQFLRAVRELALEGDEPAVAPRPPRIRAVS